MADAALFTKSRQAFHDALLGSLLWVDDDGVPGNADRKNNYSTRIARGVIARLGGGVVATRLKPQSSGHRFEELCIKFLRETFLHCKHLRPGAWRIEKGTKSVFANHEQYSHLTALEVAARNDPVLKAALGQDYLITPDVVITREPEDDSAINIHNSLVDDRHARFASLRKINGGLPLLHASISCKWTIRSDRAQNSRTEALNLVRNRKGHLPHIVAVTGEPLPSRIASLALGTGDLDCVYSFALPEIEETVEDLGLSDAEDMLKTMTEGKRLKDIADLPLDLAV